ALATARGLLAAFGTTGPMLSLTAELALVTQSLVPVFFGLRSQNEYERLSQRYGSMARELRSTLVELAHVELNRAAVERVARRFTSMVLAEVSDWQILIKARDLEPV
ncbi:MAG: hypothetical protein JO228_06030, partial [Xanthobacteraceae bacterium]|nr:hypothetical protein [Xanthobacteraceae bacterium]